MKIPKVLNRQEPDGDSPYRRPVSLTYKIAELREALIERGALEYEGGKVGISGWVMVLGDEIVVEDDCSVQMADGSFTNIEKLLNGSSGG